jgi:hypothetical protein
MLQKGKSLILNMLKIVKRDCTIQDFLKMKNYEPWKFQRNKCGKVINFSLLFGESAIAFSAQLEKDVFSEEEVDEFIQDAKLTDKLNELLLQKTFPQKKCKYIVAATFIREAFFGKYIGLGQRLQREVRFAKDNGYVRSWHGPVRHLAPLMYMDFSPSGNLRNADKELYSKIFSGLKNDAGNSPIQTLESAITQRAIIEESFYIKEWNLKSRVWNQCHDSADWYIYVGDGDEDPDNETNLVCALMYHCDTKNREPFYGIPMDIDAEIADLSTDENIENGNYYHTGKEIHFKDLNLQNEVKKWNDLHNTNIEYKDLDDLTWQL